MAGKNNGIIIRYECSSEQLVGEIIKIVGLVQAKYLIPVIDHLNLEANPRSSKTGNVTDAICETIENDPELFPVKTKGILLATSYYERLERKRFRIVPADPAIEGILDGGHNTLAIGLYMLKNAMEYYGGTISRGAKTWEEFKELWEENRNILDGYLKVAKEGEAEEFDFLVPVELLVPRDVEDSACVGKFKNDLLEICAARNNNVQLQLSAKANQKGYFDDLRLLMEKRNSGVSDRVEWKTNDGGEIKVQDIIALSWIPLNLISLLQDGEGKVLEPVAPNKLYSAKGSCLVQFEKLMALPQATVEDNGNYKHKLTSGEIMSALGIAAELPELYDYIYSEFPRLYNRAGGNYGDIAVVKKMNSKRKVKKTPFTDLDLEVLSPGGFIIPLVYGLQALMENVQENEERLVRWKQPPMSFLRKNLDKIVEHYMGILSICDYDSQKVGKALQSYQLALSGFKMAVAGII
ncbi:MAG: hypothetical protein K2N63_00905 [Lachnospiraceae bacterium]|nr:hypothetical protein [Lachnospiraceae bacterium]